MNWNTSENDLEVLYNLAPLGDHQLSMGGNVRAMHIGSEMTDPQEIVLNDQPYEEYLAGAFLVDRWNLNERLTLEGQVRGDWYSETQADWSSRISTLYALDEAQNHDLRLSWAKSFRAPLASLRKTSTQRVPLFGPIYAFNLIESGDLDNEQTWAWEAGYTGRLAEGLSLRVDTYYQRFEDMISARDLSTPPQSIYQMANMGGAVSYGVELEIAKVTKLGKFSTWYAFNEFQKDDPDGNWRSYAPAKNKVGLTGRLFLPNDWTLNTNYRYTSKTTVLSGVPTDIDPTHRLDLTVAKEFGKGAGELMIGIADLLNDTSNANYMTGALTAHTTPGRTVFGRLQWNF